MEGDRLLRGRARGLRLVVALTVLAAVGTASWAGWAGASRAEGLTATVKPLSVELIRAPRRVVFDDPVFMLSTRRLVFVRDPGGASSLGLYSLDLRPDRRRPARLPLPRDPSCRSVSYSATVALPNQQLGYLATCLGNPARLPNRAVTLNQYDARTRRSRRIVPYYLPLRSGRYGFERGMRRGLINDGDGLKWLGRRALLRSRIGVPWAAYPAWSPDGQSIVLVSGVRDGPNEGPQAIYVVDAKSLAPRRLVSNLDSAGPVAWSPDGRRLVGALTPLGKPAGLWLIDVATGRLDLLLEGDQFGSTTWLPDARTIIAGVGIYSNLPGGKTSPASPVGLDIIRLPRLRTQSS